MFKLFLFSTLICGLYSIEFDHPCRSDVPAKENFLAIVYEGIWYINQRSDVAGPECLTHRYTRIVNKTLSFNHLEEGVLDGAPFRETGIAVIAHPDVTPIRAIFNATVDQNEGSPIEFQYQVIATDYSNYAITWMCTDLPDDRSIEQISIQSRTIELSSANLAKIDFILSEINLDRSEYRTINHDYENCGFH